MASKALPAHLKSSLGGVVEDGIPRKHHGKSQSHVVSILLKPETKLGL
jgi:hypothetical protein